MATHPTQRWTERAVFWRGLAIYGLGVALYVTVEAFTRLHDQKSLEPLCVAIEEATSAVAMLPATWFVWRAFKTAPPGATPLWRLAGVHALGALVMSGVHVGLFTLMRGGIFALLGRSYAFGPITDFPYEFRKDLIGYVVAVAIFWVLTRLAQPNEAGPAAPPATFDIRDGGRVIRAAVGEIRAVTSAGNYVQFILGDGRRPLMRASLSRMEAELGPHGFVRTHRSWLVNATQVTELRPESSGDYRVSLDGVEAPVSRRYPQALAQLRQAPQSLARST